MVASAREGDNATTLGLRPPREEEEEEAEGPEAEAAMATVLEGVEPRPPTLTFDQAAGRATQSIAVIVFGGCRTAGPSKSNGNASAQPS